VIAFLVICAIMNGSDRVAGDACASMLPADLRKVATRKFPAYRLPRQSDNLPEDIRFNLEHGGNGCQGVAAGDFNGDGQRDIAFLAMSRKDVRLVVALKRSASWHVEKIWTAGEPSDRNRLYVDVGPPGEYVDLGLGDQPGPGQVEKFTSKSDVVVTGMTESTGIAFWKGPKGWVHVWISD
jgi:hypothetical protein